MASPLVILASICDKMGLEATPAANGLWLLRRGNRVEAAILVATGCGTRKVAALESSIRYICNEIAESSVSPPDIVLLGSVVTDDRPQDNAVPTDIVDGEEEEDIVSGPREPLIVIAENADAVAQAEEWLNAA
jgi:hypothetical protein